MIPNELAEIIAKHRKWLTSEPDGEKADLRGADLREAHIPALLKALGVQPKPAPRSAIDEAVAQ